MYDRTKRRVTVGKEVTTCGRRRGRKEGRKTEERREGGTID